jgi:hypothetical protein
MKMKSNMRLRFCFVKEQQNYMSIYLHTHTHTHTHTHRRDLTGYTCNLWGGGGGEQILSLFAVRTVDHFNFYKYILIL